MVPTGCSGWNTTHRAAAIVSILARFTLTGKIATHAVRQADCSEPGHGHLFRACFSRGLISQGDHEEDRRATRNLSPCRTQRGSANHHCRNVLHIATASRWVTLV